MCDGYGLLFGFGRTGYVQEHVNIGSDPPGSKVRWFRSSKVWWFINTVTFDSKPDSPNACHDWWLCCFPGFLFSHFWCACLSFYSHCCWSTWMGWIKQTWFHMQKHRHGSLILLMNGEKPKTWAILYYLDILLVVMLLPNMRSRWISSHIALKCYVLWLIYFLLLIVLMSILIILI